MIYCNLLYYTIVSILCYCARAPASVRAVPSWRPRGLPRRSPTITGHPLEDTSKLHVHPTWPYTTLLGGASDFRVQTASNHPLSVCLPEHVEVLSTLCSPPPQRVRHSRVLDASKPGLLSQKPWAAASEQILLTGRFQPDFAP